MKIVRQADSSKIFPFIAYIPENLPEKPAVIFHLHGAGERGNGGNELDRVLKHGIANVANDETLKDAILIMPQCPPESFWAVKAEKIKEFIDIIVSEYSADKDRIYLCGLSMGGYGTWYTAMAFPETFAAIAPCCGGGMPWNAGVLTMPIKTFHGLEDDVVSPFNTIDMIRALENWHPNFSYELYEGVGHNSWVKAFTPELIDWLLAQHK